MFDHTTCVAENDPYLPLFKQMDDNKIIQLRILPGVGAEKFAQYLYEKLGRFVNEETDGRVKVTKVDFYENHRNMASYSK
jgi:6-pyruvoyltetrahydropterin/6-carboxytetrahydropterin synthase